MWARRRRSCWLTAPWRWRAGVWRPRLRAVAGGAGGAAAHSSMTKPLPRGALDRNLSIFKDGAFTQHKVGTHSGCSW